jgi:hypothetical protein
MDPNFSERIRLFEKLVVEKCPHLWAKVYPRRYNDLGGHAYDTPKAVAIALSDAVFAYVKKGTKNGEVVKTETEEVEAMWAATLIKFGVPTYYITYDLAEALTKTTPVEVVDWTDMKLPFDAASFMLPKELFLHPGEEGWVSFVSYTRNYGNTHVILPTPNPKNTWELTSQNDTFNVIVRTNTGCTMHWTLDGTFKLIDFKEADEMVSMAAGEHHTSRDPNSVFNDSDIDVMRKAVKLLFNIFLFMTSKPEMVEPAKLMKKLKAKDGERPVEYWAPHYIGRAYKLRRPSHKLGGTHASPRGHWVSGFWREQAYGVERKLRKTLWIEPFFRGGGVDE